MKEAIHIQLLKPSMTKGTWDNFWPHNTDKVWWINEDFINSIQCAIFKGLNYLGYNLTVKCTDDHLHW